MSFLDTLASEIYAGFKGEMRPALLFRPSTTSGALDDNGDEITPVPAQYDCEGFPDEYSAFYKRGAGIADSDLKCCLFGASLPTGIKPQKDDLVLMMGVWYQLRTTPTDPAEALWECQAYVTVEPEGYV